MNLGDVMKKYSNNLESKFEVKNEAQDGAASIYIEGAIGGIFSSASAVEIRRQVNSIEKDQINVHINSPGGDVFDGVAIHNLLKNHKAEIIVYVDGIAASAASVIAMAGDKIIMPRNTMMMIHNASTFGFGNAKAFKKLANDLEKVDSGPVLQSYTSRFVGEQGELQNLLDDETFLTADECYSLGFADEVAEEIELEETSEPEGAKENILAKYAAQQDKANGNQQLQNNPQSEGKHTDKQTNVAKIFQNFFDAFNR
ncbi:head maturation protease, ClpP-related [Pontibacillus salicampi]|uniref:ATP-dependent Clp protease proteolytic subunit n=1 Tax=Pontibacillus salicampi TaxID=1449801 RepID=A0ABV6LTY0_9BACI